MISKEDARKKIAELVERFTEQYHSYKRADYNELVDQLLHLNEEKAIAKLDAKITQL